MVDQAMFDSDRQGRQFGDVWKNYKALALVVCAIVNDPTARQRMVNVVIHLGLPALVGVVRELEHSPEGKTFCKILRLRQFAGVAVRMAMEELGFTTTGRKGYVGTFSRWFTRAEAFAPPVGHPERVIWEWGEESEGRGEGKAA